MRLDFLSIVGIIVAFAALLGGNFLEGGTWQALFNFPAALIVLGGTLGAAILQTPKITFKRALKLLSWVFFPPQTQYKAQIQQIALWADIARRQGLLGLENMAEKEKDPFAKKALNLLVDGCPVSTIREILRSDIALIEQRDVDAMKVYASMAGYAPTIGIIGAVMGLIYVMKNLADPSELGSGIAVAFVATIYGVALANLLLLPIANKLTVYINRQAHAKELFVDGIIYIAEGENPHAIAMRLDAYLE